MTAPIIRGYAVLFNVHATVEGGETEIVQEGAFADMIRGNASVGLQFDSHDQDAPQLPHNGISFFEDAFGLGFEAEIDTGNNNVWPMLSAIVRGTTNRCSVNFTRRQYDNVDDIQIVVAASINHIAITSTAIYAATCCWRSDCGVDDAPSQVREWAERWEAGRAAAAAESTVRTMPISAARKRAAAAFRSSDAVTIRMLKAYGGVANPHRVVRPSGTTPASNNDSDATVEDLLVDNVNELVDRLLLAEERLAALEQK